MKKVLLLLAMVTVTGFMAVPTLGEDKLVVKDSGGSNTVFAVEDGASVPNRILRVSGGVPIMQNTGTAGFDFKNTGATFGASVSVGTGGNPNLYANWLASTNAKDDVTKVSWGLRLDVATDKFRVLRYPAFSSSNVALLEVNGNASITSSTGASLTAGGVWTDASSRDYKDNIEALTKEDAFDTLRELNPVRFAYKSDRSEKHVGFIAEDVPDLVATKDRKGLSPMDIVAVLTKVVKEQQGLIKELEQRLLALEGKEKQ